MFHLLASISAYTSAFPLMIIFTIIANHNHVSAFEHSLGGIIQRQDGLIARIIFNVPTTRAAFREAVKSLRLLARGKRNFELGYSVSV